MTDPRVIDLPYRAHGRAFWGTAAAFVGLVLLEGAAMAALPLAFVQAPLRWGLAGVLLLLCVGVPLRLLLAPLFTRHRLTPTHLHLRYGRHRVDVPRDRVRAAAAVREKVEGTHTLSARYQRKKQTFVACFSEHGQVALELDPPLALPAKGSAPPRECRRIVLNVDDPARLLAELGTSTQPAGLDAPADASALHGRTAATAEGASAEAERVVRIPRTDARPESGAAIETRRLTQRYQGGFTAVDGLDLRVGAGEIYGFLGLNGAGKTTTIKMLVGLLEPTSGQALVAGHDVWAQPLAAKAAFGYVPDRAILYDQLTGREFLEFLAQLRGLPRRASADRIAELLEVLDLRAHAHRGCGTYSFGMKRKLSLAAALLHRPAVLLLDEPFNGLDPRSAHRLKTLFAEMQGDTTFLLSTHDLPTAQAVCDRVGILHGGRLIAEGTPAEVQALAAGGDLEQVFLALTDEAPAEVAA